MRGLLDDKSSINNDSMNDTITRFGENNSLVNMSDGRIRYQQNQDVVVEQPSKEDGKFVSRASLNSRSNGSSRVRRSFVSGRSMHTMSHENNFSSKSPERSPLRSSVGGDKKQYDVILGSADKIYPNGILS